MTLTPQEIHEIKLTLTRLEKETPEQWAVGFRRDYLGRRCILGHLDYLKSTFHTRSNPPLLNKLIDGLFNAQTDQYGQYPGIHCLNNNLGGNKRKILDVLWGLLDKL